MTAGLRALLTGVIDYAGLFPPAKLPLDQAIRNYARYRQSPESWMLGRFICPADRLQELVPFLDLLLESGPPVSLSVLGRGGKDIDEFMTGFRADQAAIAAFQKEYGRQAVVNGMELRAPRSIVADRNNPWALNLFTNVLVLIDELPLPIPVPYWYEVDLGPKWKTSLNTLLAVLQWSLPHARFLIAGYKLRCGGLEASAFPSPEQVAFTIYSCCDFKVPLKFTAGLHHPIRHFDVGVQTKMHGFLNVFGASVLGHCRGLTQDQVRQIIKDEDPASFVFDEECFRWRDIRATTAEITAARQKAVISFGSCSFDEPRDDLRALGLL